MFSIFLEYTLFQLSSPLQLTNKLTFSNHNPSLKATKSTFLLADIYGLIMKRIKYKLYSAIETMIACFSNHKDERQGAIRRPKSQIINSGAGNHLDSIFFMTILLFQQVINGSVLITYFLVVEFWIQYIFIHFYKILLFKDQPHLKMHFDFFICHKTRRFLTFDLHSGASWYVFLISE